MCDLHLRDGKSVPERLSVADFVDELVVAITNCRIYWKEHPRVKASIKALIKTLHGVLGRAEPAHLVIGAAEGCLFFEKRPLLGASLSAPRIIEPLERLESGGLSFSNWATENDFVTLVELFGRKASKLTEYKEANRLLEEGGCSSIQLLPSYEEVRSGFMRSKAATILLEAIEEGRAQKEDIGVPVRLYQYIVDHLQDAMVHACHGEDITMEETRGLVEAILKRIDDDAESMMRISRYERYDAYTFGHSIRVCFLALNFALSLTDDEELLHRIGLSALVHDIGKAWVPFEILHSTGRLSPDERLEMNKHTVYGGEILLELGDSDPMPVATAFGHHRTLDQGGYPNTLHSSRQCLGTKIVKLCDVYEALTAVRPYKPRMSPTRAFRIMISMKNHFDLHLLRKYIEVNGIYPVGSKVRLSNGEIARVCDQTDLLEYPVVSLDVDDPSGFEPDSDRRTIDLGKAQDGVKVEELLVEESV